MTKATIAVRPDAPAFSDGSAFIDGSKFAPIQAVSPTGSEATLSAGPLGLFAPSAMGKGEPYAP